MLIAWVGAILRTQSGWSANRHLPGSSGDVQNRYAAYRGEIAAEVLLCKLLTGKARKKVAANPAQWLPRTNKETLMVETVPAGATTPT